MLLHAYLLIESSHEGLIDLIARATHMKRFKGRLVGAQPSHKRDKGGGGDNERTEHVPDRGDAGD